MVKCRIFYDLSFGNNLINFAFDGIDYIYDLQSTPNTAQLTSTTEDFQNIPGVEKSDFLDGTDDTISILNAYTDVTGAEVVFLLGQGVGLFNTATGWSGNLNNVDLKAGYWLNTAGGTDIVIEGNCPSPVESDEVDIEVDPSQVSSIDGYENNLFSYIPPLQENLDISQLSNFFFTNDCETSQEIPEGSIIYHQSVGNINQSAYYSEGSWSGTLNQLQTNKAYNISFPQVNEQSFTACINFNLGDSGDPGDAPGDLE